MIIFYSFDESHTKSNPTFPTEIHTLGMKNPTPLKVGFEGGFHFRTDLELDSDSMSVGFEVDLRADGTADSNSDRDSRV